ncbi:helix-turn-helix transcriptional regulator [Georgenia faecalis]|uniref:helix-turn-helix transcriptional regulator n=1 Tax=Georgenia faecalis TaxID=2483799 RepID=UPI000FD712E5|nr:LuxR C-terminal-related transcriptional regulator [Georgenia faecalis]
MGQVGGRGGVLPRASRDAQIGAKVTEALERRAPLTVVRAPRGYGKTTAVVRWIASRAEGPPVRYVRLGLEERVGAGFWRLLRAVLEEEGVEAGPGVDDRAVVRRALTLHRRPLVLVLDDFHEAGRLEGAPAIDEDLVELVRRNDRLELVVVTRAVRDIETTGALSVDTAVVRPTDLALTGDLVQALARRRGLTVSAEHAHRIADDLGGWPAAVRACIEAAAMNGSDTVVDTGLVDDYLFGLLQDMTSDGLRDFLLRTAVPEEFSEATARVIVPGAAVGTHLRNLRAAGLLTRAHRGVAVRYSYPRAIREALVRILGETRPEVVPEVHRALMASAAQEEGPAGVLRHACLAGEWEVALAVVEEDWATLVTHHQDALVEAARAIPDALVRADSRLAVVRDELPRGMRRPGRNPGVWLPSDPAFLDLTARLRSAEGGTGDHVMVLFQWAVSAVLAGDNDTALYAFGRVREHGIEHEDLAARLMGTVGMLMTRAILGDVEHALGWARDPELADVLQGPSRDGLVGLIQASARIGYAIACVDGVLPDAAAAVARIRELRRRDDLWAMSVFARAHLATVSGSEEERARSIGALRAALRHTDPGGITEATLATTLAELLLLSGMSGAAADVLDDLPDTAVSATTRAQLLLAQGRWRDAIRVAEAVLATPATRRAHFACEVHIAWALDQLGEPAAARRAFAQAVRTAQETGLRRALHLLPTEVFESLAAGVPSARALRPADGRAPARPLEDAPVPPAPADLSDREAEVLVALRDHAGPAGIAEQLGISPNTVKTHLRRVYHKLGASSRQEALRISAHWPVRGASRRGD